MACTGQTCTQAPHSVQASFITAFLLIMLIAAKGQTGTHLVQPMHLLETSIIVSPVFKSGSLYEVLAAHDLQYLAGAFLARAGEHGRLLPLRGRVDPADLGGRALEPQEMRLGADVGRAPDVERLLQRGADRQEGR